MLEAVCAALLSLVFAVFVWKTVLRYAFHQAVAWGDELPVVLFIWIVFLANAVVLRDEEQIRFDLVYRSVGVRGRKAIVLARGALIGLVVLHALPASLGYLAFLRRERTAVLEWPLAAVYACFGIYLLGVLARAARDLVGTCSRRSVRAEG
ncbi:MAG: TRAP transporter small permease subunit [Acetobacteraceae bacterium]|nr:TRAP transporter small permease subunit [Acetobacteraceae bacterium]